MRKFHFPKRTNLKTSPLWCHRGYKCLLTFTRPGVCFHVKAYTSKGPTNASAGSLKFVQKAANTGLNNIFPWLAYYAWSGLGWTSTKATKLPVVHLRLSSFKTVFGRWVSLEVKCPPPHLAGNTHSVCSTKESTSLTGATCDGDICHRGVGTTFTRRACRPSDTRHRPR